MQKNKKLCCPRDGNPLELIGQDGGQAMGCRLCGGLWIAKYQLDGQVAPSTSRMLFHGGAGRPTSMRCPVDGGLLFEFEINGILLDRCNHCGGLWFDSGELKALLGPVKLESTQAKSQKFDGCHDTPTWWVDSGIIGEVVTHLIDVIFSL